MTAEPEQYNSNLSWDMAHRKASTLKGERNRGASWLWDSLIHAIETCTSLDGCLVDQRARIRAHICFALLVVLAIVLYCCCYWC